MAKIDKKHLDILINAGLHVSPPVKAFCDGVWVGKPTTTAGNCIPEYEEDGYTIFGEDAPPEMDAPMLKFYKAEENTWIVRGEDYAGVPGPGDFANEWETAKEAIEDILDFYFGDPKRMQAKAEAFKQPVRPSETNS